MVGKFAVLGVIAAAGLVVGGCKSDSTTTTKTKTTTTQSSASSPALADSGQGKVIPVNTMCPVGKHSFDATTRTAENTRSYKGSTIGFCCGDCAEKFDTMSAADKDKILAAAKANKPA